MTIATHTLTGAEDVRWDLNDFYTSPDDPQIEADMEAVMQAAEQFAARYHGKVTGLDSEELREALEAYEDIAAALRKLIVYAYLSWTVDTTTPALGQLLSRVQQHGNRVNQKVLFFDLEWAAAPEETAALADHPALEPYSHYLKLQRLNQPYNLSEPEEKVMSEMSLTGRDGWTRYFGEYMNRLRYPWGDTEVPQAEVLDKMRHPDRDIRQQAANSVTGVLKDGLFHTTYIFNMILAEKASRDRLRGYPTWISARNMANQIQDEAVDALVNAVTGRYDLVARYYALLKRELGLAELYDYDRYAPLEGKSREVHWAEARDIVLDAFAGFDPRMADIAGMFFEKRWIDAPVQHGKRSGAYSHPASARIHPYVFMNYTGNIDSVMTLAHELGHGVHQYVARDRGELSQNTPLTTAEMASTFGEMLVFEHLLHTETDPAVRFSMRMDKFSRALATIFRQVTMNRFEDLIHNARREKGELTSDQLSEFWMTTQRAMHGDSVILRDDYASWWSYIPHFLNTPGYVYAYAFGDLLVWALYARYKQGDPGFANLYMDALAAGGSKWPHELLAPLGVDLLDPQFWHDGLRLLDNFLDEAEAGQAG